MEAKFRQHIEDGYAFKNDSILLGTSMLDGKPLLNNLVKAPLQTFNRHGLISGATGTGKTKTLQNIVERLSEKGVPTLVMDIKGDLSGLAEASEGHPKIIERHESIGVKWEARDYPVELLSISDEPGVRMRATISEFGPVLLAKILELNDTQSGILSIIFKFCDDKNLPLLDIKDLRKVLQFISREGREEIESNYGMVSASSTGAILRKLLEVEEQGADKFFGEKSFDVEDLLRLDQDGMGYINILRLTDIQSKPKLFSTFMLCLLAEVYEKFPEQGDVLQPELVIFIDEAHLIFREASKALVEQLEIIVKLVRSKGVGIFFITQVPSDIPDQILGQLGMKVQHALRAFTAKDRRAIKMAAENYPLTEFYDVDNTLTSLGIGEAMVTVLNRKGIPTPLVHTLLTAPSSRMDILTKDEIKEITEDSELVREYNNVLDRESAYEILIKKLNKREEDTEDQPEDIPKRSKNYEKSTFEKILNHSITKSLIRDVTRGIMGVLGIKPVRSTRRRTYTRKRRKRS
jgi:DNA helicase HerA-like ATPase